MPLDPNAPVGIEMTSDDERRVIVAPRDEA
jgi:hypothetical protein